MGTVRQTQTRRHSGLRRCPMEDEAGSIRCGGRGDRFSPRLEIMKKNEEEGFVHDWNCGRRTKREMQRTAQLKITDEPGRERSCLQKFHGSQPGLGAFGLVACVFCACKCDGVCPSALVRAYVRDVPAGPLCVVYYIEANQGPGTSLVPSAESRAVTRTGGMFAVCVCGTCRVLVIRYTDIQLGFQLGTSHITHQYYCKETGRWKHAPR